MSEFRVDTVKSSLASFEREESIKRYETRRILPEPESQAGCHSCGMFYLHSVGNKTNVHSNTKGTWNYMPQLTDDSPVLLTA